MHVTWYNILQVIDKLTDVAYEYSTITSGHRLYDKLTSGHIVGNYVYAITGSSTSTLNRNNTNLIITAHENHDNLSSLTTLYDKANITTIYYDKTYINTNYYGRTTIDTMLNAPIIYYAGFISSAGAVKKSSVYYTFTVNTSARGANQTLCNVSMSGGTKYTVTCSPRVSTANFGTYSNQSATRVTFYV